eukprot:3813244-Rhodomonas_salina.1
MIGRQPTPCHISLALRTATQTCDWSRSRAQADKGHVVATGAGGREERGARRAAGASGEGERDDARGTP